MNLYPKWIILFFLYSSSFELSAQFQYLSKKQGLSQASVFTIAQDSTGFLWFGTRDGLNKYDGLSFKIYKSNSTSNSLVSNDIRALYVDPLDESIWIGTNSGLSRYEPTYNKFENYRHNPENDKSLSQDIIRTFFRDSKKRLWIGTSSGLNIYNDTDNNFTRFYLSDSKRNDVKSIVEDSSGNIWFGTTQGLFKLNNDNKQNEYSFERIDGQNGWELSDINIKAILIDANNNFWVGTNKGGLNYWDRKKNNVIVYRTKKENDGVISHDNIRAMCFDKKGNLLVGTFNGLNILKKGKTTFTKYTKTKAGTTGLSDKSVHSVFVDRQGSLWVGTYYGGINHIDENYQQFVNFKYASIGNGVSGEVISSFAEDNKGNWWIGTEGNGLNYYNRKKKSFTNFKHNPNQSNSLSGNNVKQLLLDGDNLWIGTFRAGLNLYDLKDKKFKHYIHDETNPNSLANNNVYGLKKIGNLLWVLTYGGGIDILDLETGLFHHFNDVLEDKKDLSSNLTRVIIETTDHTIWIGTDRGLNKIRTNNKGFPQANKVFLPDNKIYSLQEDSEKRLWVGTLSNGLYCLHFNKTTFDHFTEADGLPSNTIFGILEKNNSELWLSTNNGLSKFNPVKKKFTNYNYSNGLENSEYNFNAYYKTREGDFLYGGINGFTQFNPNYIKSNSFTPPVVFTELKHNNKLVRVKIDNKSGLTQNINETKEITFKYNEANFSILFASLDYISPKNNRYAFMLEGLDRDWNYRIGKGEATYIIQKEGEYIFKLKGSNSDGLWNPNERKLAINVLPPPWKTWWAYLIYFVLLVASIFGLFRFIQLRHKLQLQQISKKQQEELYEMKLRFFTNITHEFRTPLTLILGPLNELISKKKHLGNISDQLSLIKRNAERLMNLVNQIMTFRKLVTDHIPMKVINSNIVEFLKEIFLLFKETAKLRNINYSIQVDKDEIFVWYDEDKLEQVFYNLLSNAFKFVPENGNIEMVISSNQKYLEVQIKDNGPGVEPALKNLVFKRFYEKSNSDRSIAKGSGIGLAISKQMVELHNGKIFIKDDSSGSHKKNGATFVVQIPLGKKHFKPQEIVENIKKPVQIKAKENIQNTIDDNKISKINSANNDASLILVVEDNYEVQTYIKSIFLNDYRVICAKNGSEGLQKAKKNKPDLIVSDVMMPVMDGITFCENLKSDIEISHIPIILLTARAASIFKIEGLKTGADDYLTKPFNPEELKLRVRNIVNNRQEIKDKFIRILSFDPKEIAITSADEIFLKNALSVVEDNIGNYNFNVTQFATELAVSRPLLFTKFKALTGQTPNNFIKSIRLKRAAQLLKTQKLNISEICSKVGFKDPKYFRKCFQEQFGVLPSKYCSNI